MSDTPNPTPIAPTLRATVAARGRRLLRYGVGFVIVVVIIDGVVGEKGLLAMLKARRDYVAVERALTEARAQNERLREEARRLRDDPAAIEELARRELGLIRPGETLFILRDK